MQKMNLQLFADTGTGSANSGTGTGDTGATGDGAQNNAGTDGQTAGKTTYSQEDLDRIATERASRASQSAMKDYLKQQGLDDAGIAEAIKDFKAKKAAAEEAAKGDATKQQKRAEEAEAKAAKLEAEAFADLVEAKSEAIAASLGIDPAKLAYIRLDFSKVGKTETGKPKAEDIKAVLEGAIKVMPELKGKAEAQSGFKAGTEGKKQTDVDDDSFRRAMGLPPKK